MLKNISNLGAVLNKSEQKSVKGRETGTPEWKLEYCYQEDYPHKERCKQECPWIFDTEED